MKVVSNKGVVVDMGALAAKNEDMVALGNASMNARGDIIGPGGKVVKSREQIAQEYYATSPQAVRNVALRDLKSEVFQTPQEAIAAIEKKPEEKKKPARKIEDSED